MKTSIYCVPTEKGIHSFYLVHQGEEYFLFKQNYRKGVHRYFSKGVILGLAMDVSRAVYDHSLIHTMEKLPKYIRSIEKEFEIAILDQTISKKGFRRAA